MMLFKFPVSSFRRLYSSGAVCVPARFFFEQDHRLLMEGRRRMSMTTENEKVGAFMPAGSVPQLFVRLEGFHSVGALRDMSRCLSHNKASIASLQKITLGNKFVALMHLWILPSELNTKRNELERALELAVGPGSTCIIEDIDESSRDSYAKNSNEHIQECRLQITCNDQPGLIFLITELLTAQGSSIGKMETRSFLHQHQPTSESILKFSLDAIVRTDRDKIPAIQRELQLISDLNEDLSIVFEADAISAQINLIDCA